MADDLHAVYRALAEAVEEGRASALATITSTQGSMPRHTGSKMLVYADGSIAGTVGGGAMESRVIATALEVISSGQARTETYHLNNLADGDPGICGGSAQIFIEPIALAPMLLIIGGGHVGKALAELGVWAGFRVVLSDDRPAFANPDYAPGLSGYIVCAPQDILEHVALTSHTYVAAVTRGLPVDLQLLPRLLSTDAAYIGLIGSRRRWAITARALREEAQLSAAQLERIHAPIGLELEAETPKEIAVSILAEIIMLRRGGTGKPMKWIGSVTEAS